MSRLGSLDQGELFFIPGSGMAEVSVPDRAADKTGKLDAKTEAAAYCCPQAIGMKQIVKIHSRVTLFFISSP